MSDFSECPRLKESRNSPCLLILPPASLSEEVPPRENKLQQAADKRPPEPKPKGTWEGRYSKGVTFW